MNTEEERYPFHKIISYQQANGFCPAKHIRWMSSTHFLQSEYLKKQSDLSLFFG